MMAHALKHRVCETCGKAFAIEAFRVRRGEGRFCTRGCAHQSWRGPSSICEECGAMFHVPPAAIRAGRRFCSRACYSTYHKKPGAIMARFWNKVNKDGPIPPHRPDLGPCWVWMASVDRSGYGKFGLSGQYGSFTHAHRFAYEMEHGPICGGRWVLHHCDNPGCVRPTHLYLGTVVENVADAVARGRIPCGERHPNAKLTEAHVVAIREEYAKGGVTQATLAVKYGVGLGTVNDAIRRRGWKHAGITNAS